MILIHTTTLEVDATVVAPIYRSGNIQRDEGTCPEACSEQLWDLNTGLV